MGHSNHKPRRKSQGVELSRQSAASLPKQPAIAAFAEPPTKKNSEEMILRRTLQNRQAQRAYRARKEAKIIELEHKVQSLVQQIRDASDSKLPKLPCTACTAKDHHIKQLEHRISNLEHINQRFMRERLVGWDSGSESVELAFLQQSFHQNPYTPTPNLENSLADCDWQTMRSNRISIKQLID